MQRNEPRALRKEQPGRPADAPPRRNPALSAHIREGNAHRARGELELAIELLSARRRIAAG